MYSMRAIATCVTLTLLAGGTLAWTNLEPASTTANSAKAASPLEPLAFLEGAWHGDMNGSHVEEIWSKPHGTSIMGIFRWCKPDGSPSIFEMLTITSEGADTRLRLRHYSPTLVAKEQADKPLTLKLADSTADGSSRCAVFEAEAAGDLQRVTYQRKGATLHITVLFKTTPATEGKPEKARPPLEFILTRRG